MACEYKAPDGRDFESVFARGSAGVDTGYKNIVGDDLGSYFAGGGSEVKTGMLTSEGVDLGDIFRPKGDADLQIMYIMDRILGGWGRYTLDLRANSWGLTPEEGDFMCSAGHSVVSEQFDQDVVVHVYKRMMEGCRATFDIYWGKSGLFHTNGEGVVEPEAFLVEQYPTVDDPRLIWRMRCTNKPPSTSHGYLTTAYYLSFKVVCNIYLH